MNISVFLLIFGVVFIAELPDKSMFASLTLSQKYKKLYVWMGAAAAFLVHVVIAVSAGHALSLLPKRILEIIVTLLFAGGAALLLFGDGDAIDSKEEIKAKKVVTGQSFLKVFSTSFIIIFIGEWGDITQIVTANYAAKYHHHTLAVALGAILGLWSVAAFGIIVGGKILEKVPAKAVQRVTGIILLIFAAISAVAAIKN